MLPKRSELQITTGNYTFAVVIKFIYLGFAMTSKNYILLDNKCKMTIADRCYCGLSRQLSNKNLFGATKLVLYKSISSILLLFLYSAQTRTLLRSDPAILGVFEGKIIRKIICPASIFISERTNGCMFLSMIWTCFSSLTSSNYAGSMSFQ